MHAAVLIAALLGAGSAQRNVRTDVSPLSGGAAWRMRSAGGATQCKLGSPPLFSFASPTAWCNYPTYAGLPASDGCYAAASVTGTKGEALTFTRATTRFCPTSANEATGVMCTSGQVCITSSGTTRGISIFRAGTNLALRSEEFDNAAWVKLGDSGSPVVTANTDVAPDGTQTADEAVFPLVGSGGHYSIIRQTITLGADGLWCVWVKKKSGSATALYINGGGGGTQAATDCAPTSTWKRCCVVATNTAPDDMDIGPNSYITAQAGSFAPNYPGITVALWGGDAKQDDAYATPYVKTEGASVTRNAEVASFAARGVGGPMSAAASVVLPTGWAVASANYAVILSTYTSGADYWLLGQLSGTKTGVEAYPGAKRSETAGAPASGRYWAYQDAANIGAGTGATSYATATKSAVSNATLNLGNYAGTNFFLDGLLSDVCVDTDATRCR